MKAAPRTTQSGSAWSLQQRPALRAGTMLLVAWAAFMLVERTGAPSGLQGFAVVGSLACVPAVPVALGFLVASVMWRNPQLQFGIELALACLACGVTLSTAY